MNMYSFFHFGQIRQEIREAYRRPDLFGHPNPFQFHMCLTEEMFIFGEVCSDNFILAILKNEMWSTKSFLYKSYS